MDLSKKIKVLYPWLKEDEIDYIIDKAKLFFYEINYPADQSIDETTAPITSQRDQLYLMVICEELCARLGVTSETGYRVNGVSREFDSAEMSKFLKTLRFPHAKSVR